MQCATGNPLNVFPFIIGLISVLKTSPSQLDLDLNLKLNLDSVPNLTLNLNLCGLAITNSLNNFFISGYFGPYTRLSLTIIFSPIIGLIFSPPKLINQNKGASGNT